MLRASPPAPILLDELDGALAKGAAACGGDQRRLPRGYLCLEGVYAAVALLPVLCRQRARRRERNIGVGAKAHVPALLAQLETIDPAFRTARGHAHANAPARH